MLSRLSIRRDKRRAARHRPDENDARNGAERAQNESGAVAAGQRPAARRANQKSRFGRNSESLGTQVTMIGNTNSTDSQGSAARTTSMMDI